MVRARTCAVEHEALDGDDDLPVEAPRSVRLGEEGHVAEALWWLGKGWGVG